MQKRRKFLEKKKNLLKPKIKILHTLGKRSKREAEKKRYIYSTPAKLTNATLILHSKRKFCKSQHHFVYKAIVK